MQQDGIGGFSAPLKQFAFVISRPIGRSAPAAFVMGGTWAASTTSYQNYKVLRVCDFGMDGKA